MLHQKSNEKSEQLRHEGNKCYSNQNFFEAMLKYNESLCYADPKSENVGLAYANRSAIYFEMKLYDKCLNNVDMARKNSYPERNLENLVKREQKCHEMVKTSNQKISNPWNFFKLSYQPNKKLPFIVNCLELNCNDKYGRFVTTNHSLKVGDIISIEEPFCKVLLSKSKFRKIPKSNIYQKCSNCLRDNSLDLIPCNSCCLSMFCSIECMETALKRFHRYECSIMAKLLESGSVHMAMRLFFIALSKFDGCFEKLEDFISNENKMTIFDCDLKSSEREGNERMLRSLMSLMKSPKIFPVTPLMEILKNHHELGDSSEKHEKFIANFLQKLRQISDWNFHGITSGSSKSVDVNETKREGLEETIGSGSLIFCSLINHSCANNVMRICVEGKVLLVVCRPISKGSQLFDCYKISFLQHQKQERQEILLKDFGFACDCEACTQNFPTPPMLKFKDPKLLKFAKKTDDEMLTLQHNQAFKKFRDCCDILEKNNQNFPCLELCLLLRCIANFLFKQAQPSVVFP
ncbi:CLUMA_CG003122, isoform A [Clunio marinus]|uniref:CLUMA_CG003122, isoform A n=1 Tax=Clunio marinus TaxID=568069 RepID=A0A1J1HSB1_9DIPT|nr:CLUMA_CG003122, isoform A [Clunio marinus]